MKKSLLFSLVIAATLPAAASASVVIQQANEDIQEPIAATAPTAQPAKTNVDAENVLGHSVALTKAEFALMARTHQTTELPANDHHLDSPEQPSDW
ncbi:hypothetical protein P1P91_13335 [Halomonas piscis]|uniref:DUF4148 domain-containing protein n=1 Tax=Halomonas piscis TaxID=3031727 RepID=A0ABY9YYU5_9GAMM|nr:hypothetical protein [Halomonas piscis]WNK19797.1 hypothetical protein P1P91_13335 [Halomonas piscis]